VKNQFYRCTGVAWLEIRGDDAFSFLQGQFTNKLRNEIANICTYGLWLDRKGKVQGDGFVLGTRSEGYRIFSYETMGEALCERLEAYIIADDVEITDRTGSVEAIGILGPDSQSIVSHMGGCPADGENVVTQEGMIFEGRRSAKRSYEIVVEHRGIARVVERIQALGLTEVDTVAVELERIRSGIPAIPRELGSGDLPQEGGVEGDAISFNKGCYLGQEVMARLQSMGRVRRRLIPVRVVGPASAPCPLFQGSDLVGELRTHIRDHDGGINGMAMIRAELAGGQRIGMNFNGEVEARVFAGADAQNHG
jgi:folate-binding protein YgfZ